MHLLQKFKVMQSRYAYCPETDAIIIKLRNCYKINNLFIYCTIFKLNGKYGISKNYYTINIESIYIENVQVTVFTTFSKMGHTVMKQILKLKSST